MAHGYDRYRPRRVNTHSARLREYGAFPSLARPGHSLAQSHLYLHESRRPLRPQSPLLPAPIPFFGVCGCSADSAYRPCEPRPQVPSTHRQSSGRNIHPVGCPPTLTASAVLYRPLLQGTSAAHCHRPITPPTSAVLVPPDPPNPSSASLILPRHQAVLDLLIFSLPPSRQTSSSSSPSKDDPSASAHHRRLSSSLCSRPRRRRISLPTCQSPTVPNGATMDLNTS